MQNATEFFSNEGMSYCEDGNFEKALESFNRGLKFDEENICLLYNKAGCLKSLHRNREADILLKRVIKLCDKEDKTTTTLKLKSDSLMILQDYEKAPEVLEELLEKSPEDVDALLNMAVCFNHKCKYQDALNYLDRILEIDSSNFHAILLKSEMLMSVDKFEESKKYLDMAYEMNPDFAHVWYLKGQYESEFSNYETALEYYEKALEIEPDATRYLYETGICRLLLGKTEKAKCSLRRIFQLHPEEYGPERYELLDKVCDIMGNHFSTK